MISGRKATINWLHASAPASARAVPALVSYPPKVMVASVAAQPPGCDRVWHVSSGGRWLDGSRGSRDRRSYVLYNTVYGVLYFSFHSVGTRALGATRHFGRLFLLFTSQTLLPLHIQNTHTSLHLSCILLLSTLVVVRLALAVVRSALPFSPYYRPFGLCCRLFGSCCRSFGSCCRLFGPFCCPFGP